MPREITVRQDDLGMMLACTVRYALTHEAAVTGDVAGRIRRYWEKLTPRWRLVIQNDLEEALHPDHTRAEPLPDHPVWDALARFLAATEKRRQARRLPPAAR